MDTTILLAKVFGSYLLVGGVAYLIRRKYFMRVMHEFVEEKSLRTILAVVELTAGLFLIYSHNIWSTLPEAVISLFGWLLAIEGVGYLFLSDRAVAKIINIFNKKFWYVGGGILSLALGLYLLNFAFAWF